MLAILGSVLPDTAVRADSPAASSNDSLVIIVNRSSRLESISISEVRSIFLGKRTTVSGVTVTPIHSKENTALYKAFVTTVLGMTAEETQQYWQDQKIKSGRLAPISFQDTSRAVFQLHNSISYTYKSQFSGAATKAILTVPLK